MQKWFLAIGSRNPNDALQAALQRQIDDVLLAFSTCSLPVSLPLARHADSQTSHTDHRSLIAIANPAIVLAP